MTRYVPGHNVKDWGGNTNRGWPRWERAARNALRNPHSNNAKLYRKRYDLALQIAESGRILTKDGPFAHMVWERQWDWDTDARTSVLKREGWRRRDIVCSIFCAVMHAQLHLEHTAERMPEAFKKPSKGVLRSHMARLEKGSLKRKATCAVCGSKVSPR